MYCFTFRSSNKVLPGNTTSEVDMTQETFIKNFYTSCELKDIDNTVFFIIQGVGSMIPPETIKFKENLIIEKIQYNYSNNPENNSVITAVSNVFNLLKDVKAFDTFKDFGLKSQDSKKELKKQLSIKDLSIGLEYKEFSTSTSNTVRELVKKLRFYLLNSNINNICILCNSHGSLIIHFLIVHFSIIIKSASREYESIMIKELRKKLKIITYGSPRYLPSNLYDLFGDKSQSTASAGPVVTSKNVVMHKHNQLPPLESGPHTIAHVQSLQCNKIDKLPSIINCYHTSDMLLIKLNYLPFKCFKIPSFKIDFEGKHFKYDENMGLLFVNNTNHYYLIKNSVTECNTLYNKYLKNREEIKKQFLNTELIKIYNNKALNQKQITEERAIVEAEANATFDKYKIYAKEELIYCKTYRYQPYKLSDKTNIKDTIYHDIQNKENNKITITSPENLYPYLPNNIKKPVINYHGDPNILYPLFNANILLNIVQHLLKTKTPDNDNNNYYIYNDNQVAQITNSYNPTTQGGKSKKIPTKRTKKLTNNKLKI